METELELGLIPLEEIGENLAKSGLTMEMILAINKSEEGETALIQAASFCEIFVEKMQPHVKQILKYAFDLLRKIEPEIASSSVQTRELFDQTVLLTKTVSINLDHQFVVKLVENLGTICPLKHRQQFFLPILERLASNQLQRMEEDATGTSRKRPASPTPSPTPPVSNEEGAATYASIAAKTPLSIAAKTPLPISRPDSPSMDATTTVTSANDEMEVNFKPMPYFLKVDKNWPKNIALINSQLATPISARISGDMVKLFPKSKKDSDTILTFFKENKLEYSHATPRSERPRKIAVRGIPHQVGTDEISEALTNLGYVVQNVTNIKDRRTKRCFNLFMIDLLPTPSWDKIYKLTELLHLKVHFRPFTSRGDKQPQCHKCQRYGHSSWTCQFQTRCVKCAGEHTAAECKHPPESKPICCLCNGGHTANYSKCPAAQKRPSKAKAKTGPPDGRRKAAADTSPPAAAPAAADNSPPPAAPDTAPKAPATQPKEDPPEAETLPSVSLVSQQPPGTGGAKKKRKHRKKRPALSAEATAEKLSVTPADEAEICVPASDRNQGQFDLPSETKELMREFCSCVSEVRAWFKECTISDVAKSVKVFKTEMDTINFSKFASFWRELETSFCLPSEPVVQMSNLLTILSRHLAPDPK